MTDLVALAKQARALAATAPPGSLARRAAGCCAVVFATTKTSAATRKALDDVRLADVRDAARQLLDQLTE